MATVNSVKDAHSRFARMIPEKIREKLGAAELKVRCEEMARLYELANSAQADHARYLWKRALDIARSIPVMQYVSRMKELGEQENRADPTMRQDSDTGKWGSMRGHYREMRDELKSANRYPDSLVEAIDSHLLSKRVADPELAAVAADIAGAA